MTARQTTFDAALYVSCIVSAVIHLAVFLLLIWWGDIFQSSFTVHETYYVDLVNLPVAAPQSGSPARTENSAGAPVPPAPPGRMTLPQPVQAKAASKDKTPTDSDAFAQKMAKLENKAEAAQQEAALARLRQKVSPNDKKGMPNGIGTEEGSDYTAYIQSRLKDAFHETISYSSKSPEMIVRLFIDKDGKLIRRKIERGTGDRTFEIAVTRALELASDKFPPPPGRTMYEGVFVFRPQGITRNKP